MEDINNEVREIPYGKNILVNCPNCGFKGEPTKYRKGNIFLEIILWLLFLIPGAIYTSLRHINTFCLCPKCKQQFLLETDGDNNLIGMLYKIRRKQLCWFWVIVVGFSILGMTSLSGIHKSYQKSINKNNRIYNYQQNNTYVEPQKLVELKNEVTLPEIKEEKQESKNEKEVKVEKPKEPNEEVREKMQNILKEIDKDYAHIDSYIGASCLGDCASSVTTINIEFSKNIGWYDFTVKAHAAGWNNKIIKAAPSYFDKIWINYIYKGQTVCSCIFTEYQHNVTSPKGCSYFGYK